VNASGDIIVGAIKFGNGFPMGYLGYLSVAAQATATNWTNFNFTTDVTAQASAGFILTGMLAISERKPNGDLEGLKVRYLNTLTWRITDVSFNSNGTGGQSSVTWTGFPVGPVQQLLPGNVSVTFVISDVLAEVTAGKVKAAVSPKHVESFIELNGWVLANPANNLRLHFGVLTGNATGQYAAKVSIATGSGSSGVYAHFAAVADVSGQVSPVSINRTVVAVEAAALIFNDVSIIAAASAVYKGNLALYSVEVSFPAGQTAIIYDPGMGAGTPIQAAEVTSTTGTASTGSTGSAETLIFSVIVMLFAMLF